MQDPNAPIVISYDPDDCCQIDWGRDPETGAYESEHASAEIEGLGDSIYIYTVGKSDCGINRPAYGQTLVVPRSMIPTVIEMLHTIWTDHQE